MSEILENTQERIQGEEILTDNPALQFYEQKQSYEEDPDNMIDWVSLSENTLDTNQLINFAKSPKAGAISTFLGTTRDTFEEKTVTYLEYEAYPEMALKSMLEICSEIRRRWSVLKIVFQHKLGPCPVLETSIAIVISSAHRKDSLHASQFAIDELKRIVPIWKKEFYEEGGAQWKSNQSQIQSNAK